ncbi:MAG: ribosome maturation factor RimM [Dehalococcoidia bacterium]
MAPDTLPPHPENPEAQNSVERVAVGRINGTWGVRGHVKVTPMTDNPTRIVSGARVYVQGVPRTITDVRHPRGFPVVLLDGVQRPEDVEALKGAVIEIDEDALPDLPEGEYYIHDLIGLAVVTSEGEAFGVVDDVLRTGSNDVYVVKRPGAKDVLVPALDGVVLEIDLGARQMTVEVVPGLLD